MVQAMSFIQSISYKNPECFPLTFSSLHFFTSNMWTVDLVAHLENIHDDNQATMAITATRATKQRFVMVILAWSPPLPLVSLSDQI